MTLTRATCGIASLIVAAAAPLASEPDKFSPEARAHWAFQKVTRPEPPPVQGSEWVSNPIDAFVLAKLEEKGLEPAPAADKITLLRRVSLDLTGLPPTPEETEAFISDQSPGAFDTVVERLLASPHYGERWARHWLDLARYAESEGFKADQTRPFAWRYRDYVVNAFNTDKPYDRFIKEQLAGDELWPENPEALVATGFNRHYPDEHNARNLMQRRQEILNDITDTVGSVFTGLTFGCARCHDHKYDPILQTDYFRLQAFFANVAPADNMVLAPKSVEEQYRKQLALWEEKTRAIREEMAQIEAPKRQDLIDELVEKYPEEIQIVLRKPAEERSPYEWAMYYKAQQYLDPNAYLYVAPSSSVAGKLKGDAKKRWEELRDQLKAFDSLHPGELPLGMGIADISAEPPKTYLLRGGAYDAPKEEVAPGFLSIINATPAKIQPPKKANSTGRRAALAQILASPENPLTSRVMVNRIWQYHFGDGLVRTASDFGLQGERPTHPELLDWLASEFIRTGWSIKQMHRLIVTSSAYRQASQHNQTAVGIDPENRLLWRYPRKRLEAEVIRDAALAVSGLLNPEMGGPSVFPEIPDGLDVPGGWKKNEDESDLNRRSIYTFIRRNTRYPMFVAFDMPDTHESCARRSVTTSPIQALSLLNSDTALKWARHFAGRVMAGAGNELQTQIDRAYMLAFGRLPKESEQRAIREFFDRHHLLLEERASAGEKLELPAGFPENGDRVRAAAMVDFCHMLLNANEFVYKN